MIYVMWRVRSEAKCPAPLSLCSRGRSCECLRGLCCRLHWPYKSGVTPAWPASRLLRRGAEKRQEKGFMCSSWVKRILLNCGFDGKHYVRLVQIFPEVCQQPQKWSLIENSWGGGWRPASLFFSMPQSCLTPWTELSPKTLPGAWQAQLGAGGDSAQLQIPAQRLKPVKPERGFGQLCQLVLLSGLGVNHWLESLQDELTNARFSGQGWGLPAGWVLWSLLLSPAEHQLGNADTATHPLRGLTVPSCKGPSTEH